MKRTLQIIIHASAVSVLAFSAMAQDAARPEPARSDHARGPKPPATPAADRLNGAAKASELLGMSVKNYQDETLGKVEELAVDVESGRVVQVIVSTGGFLGIGDTLSAVPPGALHHDVTERVLHLDADKATLKSAPPFETANWVECCDSNHLSAVYRHYGQASALTFIPADGIAPKDRQNIVGVSSENPSPKTVASRNADGTWGRARSSKPLHAMIPVGHLGQIQKASKVIGTTVKNLQDAKLGVVENLLVDLPSGRLVAVIISSGGFLGIGDELSAVPPVALRFTSDQNTLQLDASKEMLSEAPHFKANQWPDFAHPGYAGGVYRAYNVEPYFTTNLASHADNTARNVRDRGDYTLTPLDQGTGKADVNTTAQIRKEIIAGKNMSVNARNVKIITRDGRVTLRGPVNTAEEKRLIGEIADRIAQAGNVDNQLEVTVATSSSK